MKNRYITLFAILLAVFLSSCRSKENSLDISVVSMIGVNAEKSSDTEICSSFALTKGDVANYFATAEEVDEYEFNRDSIIFPCKYTGNITINGESFQWEISAGGAGYLYRGKELNRRFLCKTECSKVLPVMGR